MKEHMGQVLSAYGTLLTTVSSFRYLGQTLSSTDDDWPAMERNLRRAQVKWGHLAKILEREGVDKRMSGRFYVEVVQAVLLFGSNTWVLTPWLKKFLEGFYHWVAQCMAGMSPKRQPDRTWVYPSIGAVLVMVGLE